MQPPIKPRPPTEQKRLVALVNRVTDLLEEAQANGFISEDDDDLDINDLSLALRSMVDYLVALPAFVGVQLEHDHTYCERCAANLFILFNLDDDGYAAKCVMCGLVEMIEPTLDIDEEALRAAVGLRFRKGAFGGRAVAHPPSPHAPAPARTHQPLRPYTLPFDLDDDS